MLGGIVGELDSRHLEIPRGLLQEEAVGASELQQSAIAAIATDEIDAMGELAAQHRLGPEIVGITVGVAAGEIILGVVGGGVEAGGLGAPQPAAPALQNAAAVGLEAQQMASRAAAGRTRPRYVGDIDG